MSNQKRHLGMRYKSGGNKGIKILISAQIGLI